MHCSINWRCSDAAGLGAHVFAPSIGCSGSLCPAWRDALKVMALSRCRFDLEISINWSLARSAAAVYKTLSGVQCAGDVQVIGFPTVEALGDMGCSGVRINSACSETIWVEKHLDCRAARTHVPLPLGSPLLQYLASFEESLQVVRGPCCAREFFNAISDSLPWMLDPYPGGAKFALTYFFHGVIGFLHSKISRLPAPVPRITSSRRGCFDAADIS